MSFNLSLLDLCPIGTGYGASQALHNSVDLARQAETFGYVRHWIAEHHNIPSVASSSPEIVIAALAQATRRLRVGSGGVMLPNHAPFKVVETFRSLEALYPGRIDLGLGRAPGSDMSAAAAMRRHQDTQGAEEFPAQIAELLAFDNDKFPAGHPFERVRPMPNDCRLPPMWLLGSSGYSARMAAELGLGYAFARHINPEGGRELLAYRQQFRPSDYLGQPSAILAVAAICAPTAEEAERLAASVRLSYLRLRTGRPAPIPTPEEALDYPYTAHEKAQIESLRGMHIVGEPDTVAARITALAEETGADEIMVVTNIHGHEARIESYRLLAEAVGRPSAAAASNTD
ncbi:LLM class flavin-dependent oxidoreductase [Ectothiorhodospiraceae bacterium WFHF3C12]|nr:LLM class flavin-dependent oxidoreductase [Ectothiorhodospiraceae bacterium WFHF3C12]